MATFNNLLNKLDVKVHLPRYNYCGLETKLAKRIARGDTQINRLDDFCKQRDIIYSLNPYNLSVRREADKILAKKHWAEYSRETLNLVRDLQH